MKDENNKDVYLYFILRQHLCRVKLVLKQQKVDEEGKPPIEKLLCFPDKDLPVGMGAFAADSRLYLLGGETLKKGHHLDPDYSVSRPHIFKALSNRMFFFNHRHPKNPTIRQISSMKAPKPSPQVAIVDGKLYVFAGQQHCYMRAPPEPMFECYDPTKGFWESLPEPPCYFKDQPTRYLFTSVLGRQIIVRSQMGVWFYHVDDRTWTGSRDIENSPFECFGRVAEMSDNGVVVVYTTRGVVAYKDASLGRVQVLKDLNSCLPSPNEIMQVAFISYLGENRFCLFLSETFGGVNGDWVMHVILFRLERLPLEEEREGEEEKDFCRVFVFRHHKYNASKDITKEQFNPTHAFIMCEGFDKHGLDWLGVVGLPSCFMDRASSADGGSGRTLQKLIQTSADLDAKQPSKSAKRNLKKKERRLRKAKGWNTGALSSAEDVNEAAAAESVASPIEGLNISSNPSTVIDAPKFSTQGKPGFSSVHERIEELKRKIQVLKQKLGPDEEQVEICEGLHKELILLEREIAENPPKGGLDTSMRA